MHSICYDLPALSGGHDTLVVWTLTVGVVVMGHPQVVSQLVRHRGGYLNQLVPGILSQREKQSTSDKNNSGTFMLYAVLVLALTDH